MPELAILGDLRLVFDPTLTTAQLSNNAFFNTSDDTGAIDAALENAASEFQLRADMEMTLSQVRKPETHEVERSGHQAYKANFSQVSTDYTPRTAKIHLDHSPVLPIDANEGDSVEIRTGMNEWTDVTDNSNDEFDLVSSTAGTLLVDLDRVTGQTGVRLRHLADERYVRVSYRYGATGGRVGLAGQTTLDGVGTPLSSTDNTPTTVSVADASRLPSAPAVVLLNETEYVSLSSVDTAADEITVSTRGERFTSATEHSSGVTVHYAPLYARSAVAKKAAIDLTQQDSYSEWMPDTDIPLEAPRKIDEWRNDWQTALEVFS